MATRIESPPEPGRVRGVVTGRERPARGPALWGWLFMRVSGIALLFLAVGHVLIMHVLDEGIDRVDFAFVQLRWQSPFWKTWDWLMLSLALLHGVLGLRMITQDYVQHPARRRAVDWFFAIAGIAILLIGTYVVVSFDPAEWPSA